MKTCPECLCSEYEIVYDTVVAVYVGPFSVVIDSIDEIGKYDYMKNSDNEDGLMLGVDFTTNFSPVSVVCNECGNEIGTFKNEAAFKEWLTQDKVLGEY